jgi:hypothetical protein
VKEGRPVFAGQAHEWSEVEGWYVIAPGNVQKYLEWLLEQRRKAREGEVGGDDG